MTYQFRPKGVCSRKIEIETDGDIVRQVKFEGGCNGNQKGIASLVKGMRIDEVVKRLKGIRCGAKSTSCPDQLAEALQEIKQKKKSP